MLKNKTDRNTPGESKDDSLQGSIGVKVDSFRAELKTKKDSNSGEVRPLNPVTDDQNFRKNAQRPYQNVRSGDLPHIKSNELNIAMRCIQEKLNEWLKLSAEKGTKPVRLQVTGAFDAQTLDAILDFYCKEAVDGKKIAAIKNDSRIQIGPKTLLALESAIVKLRKDRAIN